MKSVKVRSAIEQLRGKRAGSIFSKEFEAGWLYGLLVMVDDAPDLQTREDVDKWVKTLGDIRKLIPELASNGT